MKLVSKTKNDALEILKMHNEYFKNKKLNV